MLYINSVPPPTTNYSSAALRYPDDGSGNAGMTEQSDYVLFQFYEYKPPFQNNNTLVLLLKELNSLEITTKQINTISRRFISICRNVHARRCLYWFRGNWGGKAISTVGSNLLAAGADGFNKITSGKQLVDALGRSKQILGAAAIKKAVQAIGGDNLSNDDIFGAISGSILNPNTELLFNSVDMRNFQLNLS